MSDFSADSLILLKGSSLEFVLGLLLFLLLWVPWSLEKKGSVRGQKEIRLEVRG